MMPASPRPVLADHDRLRSELSGVGLGSPDSLDPRLRCVAIIAAQCIGGVESGLQEAIRAALALGLSAQAIKGIVIELMFYAGVPATVSGLRIAHKVIGEREDWKSSDVPLDAEWLNDIDDMIATGRTRIAGNWGEPADREIEASLARRMVPEAARIVDGYHFGQVWARTDLDVRERTVCGLAALMCRGHWRQFARHVGYALDAGLGPREILQIVAQSGWIRGWPHVEDALAAAKTVFDQRGIAMPVGAGRP